MKRITRKLLETKLNNLKTMDLFKGKLDDLDFDFYGAAGGYRLEFGQGGSVANRRISAQEMNNALEIVEGLIYLLERRNHVA